jgi:cytochrome P450
MQLAAEMNLPEIPVLLPDFDQDPQSYIDAARREHPWLAKCSLGYFVYGYHANRDMLAMDDNLRPAGDGVVEFYGAQNTPWARFMREMLIHSHGPDHDRIRANVADAFTPRSVNRFRSLMRQLMSDLLDEWVPKRSFDVSEFAANFPIKVMCALLGTSDEPVQKIRRALDTQVASMSLLPDLLPEILSGYDVLWNFAEGLIKEREAAGQRGDGRLLDSLMEAEKSGKISEVELRFLLMLLFPAGYDTTRNSIATTVCVLMDYPEYWERCAEDRTFVSKIMDEILRHSPVTAQFRIITRDFEYGDVRFPKDAMMIFTSLGAGRDPSVFENPLEIQPNRVSAHRHFAFGRGTHMCLGQHLVRTLMEESIHLITQRIKKPRLVGKVVRRPFLGISGIQTLPIAFEPGEEKALN